MYEIDGLWQWFGSKLAVNFYYQQRYATGNKYIKQQTLFSTL